MTYKETLYFIAKCLTITLDDNFIQAIKKQLISESVDWDLVVKVSTAHYVLPALYYNFKRLDFLKYLPADLVKFMKNISILNKNRNIQIIKQANELNGLLLENDIKPIFLKGTGNLLEGLYDYIGERMVGDIDILLSKKDFLKTIDILKKNNYEKQDSELDYLQEFRHYSRLINPGNIAAVEIHKEVIIPKYREEFSCEIISKDIQLINNFLVLSFENQLSLSIISSQINDYGFELKNFSLRNAYDVFLFSKKVDTIGVISKFENLNTPINCFLANCNLVFGDLESLKYNRTPETEKYLKTHNKFLNNSKLKLKINFKIFANNLFRRLHIVSKSIFDSENRRWLMNRIKRKIRI